MIEVVLSAKGKVMSVGRSTTLIMVEEWLHGALPDKRVTIPGTEFDIGDEVYFVQGYDNGEARLAVGRWLPLPE